MWNIRTILVSSLICVGISHQFQWVKCLLYRHKDLGSNPQHPYQKLGIMAHSCNPSALGKRPDDLRAYGAQPRQPAGGSMKDTVWEN